MAIVYAKTKNVKYATRTNYVNIIHISVPADRIVTSWLDMCYTMHYPELLSSLNYYKIICHYKVTNRDKIKAFYLLDKKNNVFVITLYYIASDNVFRQVNIIKRLLKINRAKFCNFFVVNSMKI